MSTEILVEKLLVGTNLTLSTRGGIMKHHIQYFVMNLKFTSINEKKDGPEIPFHIRKPGSYFYEIFQFLSKLLSRIQNRICSRYQRMDLTVWRKQGSYQK